MDVLLRQCHSDCGSVSLQLLQVLVTVQSLSAEPQLGNKVRKDERKALTVRKTRLFFPLFYEAQQIFELWRVFARVQSGHGRLCN